MRNRITLLLIALSLAACDKLEKPKKIVAPAKDPSAVGELVPTDAVALVRFESREEFAEIVKLFSELVGAEGDDPFEEMVAEAGADAKDVDEKKPFFMAVQWSKEMPFPAPTYILPAGKAEGAAAVKGGYAAFPEEGGYKPGGSALAGHVLAGDISARVDLARIVDAYRAEIDAGLDDFAKGFAMGFNMAAPGYDAAEITQSVVDWIKQAVESAETLDAVVDVDGGAVDLRLLYTAKEGSALDTKVEKSRLLELARHVPAGFPFAVLVKLDMAGLVDLFMPMMDVMIERLPEDQREGMQTHVKRMMDLQKKLGEDWMFAFGFDGNGMRMAAVVHCDKGEEYIKSYAELVASPMLEALGYSFKDEGTRKEGGLTVHRLRMNMDMAKMAEFMGMGAEMAQMPFDVFKALLGENGMAVDLVAKDGKVFMVGDSTGKLLDSVLKTDRAPESLAATLKQIPGEAGFVAWLDLRGFMKGFTELMAKVMPGTGPPEFPDGETLPIALHGSRKGRVYHLGATFDIKKIGEYFAGAKEAAHEEERIVTLEVIARTKCKQYYDAAKFWRLVKKQYPATLKEMEAPLNEDDKQNFLQLEDDPWGNPYVLEVDGDEIRIRSWGPDAQEGTDDDVCYPALDDDEDTGEDMGDDEGEDGDEGGGDDDK